MGKLGKIGLFVGTFRSLVRPRGRVRRPLPVHWTQLGARNSWFVTDRRRPKLRLERRGETRDIPAPFASDCSDVRVLQELLEDVAFCPKTTRAAQTRRRNRVGRQGRVLQEGLSGCLHGGRDAAASSRSSARIEVRREEIIVVHPRPPPRTRRARRQHPLRLAFARRSLSSRAEMSKALTGGVWKKDSVKVRATACAAC